MADRSGVDRWAATVVAVVLVTGVVGEAVFAALHWDHYLGRGVETLERLMFILVLGGLGALIVRRRPRHPVGWLLVTAALLRQVSVLESVVDVALARGAEVTWVHVLVRGLWPSGFTFALLGLAVLVFPAGRLPSRRWRPVVWLVGAMGLVDVVCFNLYPALDARRVIARSGSVSSLVPMTEWGPLGFDRHVRRLPELEVVQAVFIAMLVAILALAVSAQVHRWRHAGHDERQQVKWLIPAVILWAVGLAATAPPFGMPPDLMTLMVLPLPVCMAIAILHHRAYDIDIIISRTLVYGVLSIGIFVTYALITAGLGVATESRFPVEVAITVTAVLTLAFQPLRRWLQGVADRLVFGERPTPLEAVAGLEVEASGASPEELLAHLAETVRLAARLRWASVVTGSGLEQVAGQQTGEIAATTDIEHGGEQFGQIRCGPKLRGRFDETDGHLLRALASQTALVLSNAQLANRLVQGQEGERRRIERNIHDGAQQELVALIAKLTVARNHARHDRLEAHTLDELQRDAGHILTELRDLAQGIHPTVLTDGGIVEAVEDRCRRLPVDVVVEASAELRQQRFDDDIEGASYFFVTEGLTNVLKHAHATAATVEIRRCPHHLEIEVRDDGDGFDTATTRQNGLAGLSDRFRALGGRVAVDSQPGGGTVLYGSLPMGRP